MREVMLAFGRQQPRIVARVSRCATVVQMCNPLMTERSGWTPSQHHQSFRRVILLHQQNTKSTLILSCLTTASPPTSLASVKPAESRTIFRVLDDQPWTVSTAPAITAPLCYFWNTR